MNWGYVAEEVLNVLLYPQEIRADQRARHADRVQAAPRRPPAAAADRQRRRRQRRRQGLLRDALGGPGGRHGARPRMLPVGAGRAGK